MIGNDQKKIGILFMFGFKYDVFKYDVFKYDVFKYDVFKYDRFKYCTIRTLLKILAIIQMQDALRARFASLSSRQI